MKISKIPNFQRLDPLELFSVDNEKDSRGGTFVINKGGQDSQTPELGANHPPSGDVTDVPVPIPDSGFRTTQSEKSWEITPTGSHHRQQTTISTSNAVSSVPMYTASTTTNLIILPENSSVTVLASSTSTSTASSTPHSRTAIPTSVVIAVVVGVSLLVVALLITAKICLRPRRAPRPTPSLPIPYGSFPDERAQVNESPVFGGKERFSPKIRNDEELWAWTPYIQPQSKQDPAQTANPLPQAPAVQKASEIPRLNRVPSSHTARNARTRSSTESTHTRSRSAPLSPAVLTSFPEKSKTNGERQSRVSFYGQSIAGLDIGLAIGDTGKSSAYSPLEVQQDRPRKNKTILKHTLPGAAYDGADVTSPKASEVALTHSQGGRAPIKSTYFAPGLYPRISRVQPQELRTNTKASSANRRSSSFHKSAAYLDRDPSSPSYGFSPETVYTMPSPQPTLYPDDSLSIMDCKKPKNQQKKSMPPTEATSTVVMTADAAFSDLGNLMLRDSDPAPFSEKSERLLPKPSERKRCLNDDKPPHIPLPPPFPSLAQMALGHANPQAYADYRSPTYSICGLYESDEKNNKVGSGYR